MLGGKIKGWHKMCSAILFIEERLLKVVFFSVPSQNSWEYCCFDLTIRQEVSTSSLDFHIGEEGRVVNSGRVWLNLDELVAGDSDLTLGGG